MLEVSVNGLKMLFYIGAMLYLLYAVVMQVFTSMGRLEVENILDRRGLGDDEAAGKRMDTLFSRRDYAIAAGHLLSVVAAALMTFAALMLYYEWGLLYAGLVVLAGEVVVKGIADSIASELVFYAGGAFVLLAAPAWIVFKLAWLVKKIVDRLLGRDNGVAPPHEELEEEVMAIVSEGERGGVIEETDRDFIEGVFDLKDKDVAEIMMPRTDIVFIDADATMDEVLRIATESGHSRIPVFRETRDEIVGIFYVKDLLAYWGREEDVALTDIMREPYFIPESRKVSGLLKDMQERRVHVAVVIDEYGGTAGLVTVEDIVEEIFGEISDEYDSTKAPLHRKLPDGGYEVSGRIHVDEMNDLIGVEIPEDEEYDTIGGLIVSELGRIPEDGEVISMYGLEFRVTVASDRRVETVEVRRTKEED